MDGLHAVPLTEVPLAEAARAMVLAYQGYIVPVQMDAAALAHRIRAEHVDLTASRLYRRGDEPAGLLLIARRGALSRIAALGFVPALRGQGLGGQALAWALAEARARRDAEMRLEVIEGNDTARRAYERAGFAIRRRLAGYAHDGAPAATGAEPCAPDRAFPLLAAAARDPSWQTSPLCFARATAPVRGLVHPQGLAAALVQPQGEGMRLLAFAVAPAARGQGLGRAFMAAVLGQAPGRPWSIPAILPEDLAPGLLAAAGWRKTALAQAEMACPLAR